MKVGSSGTERSAQHSMTRIVGAGFTFRLTCRPDCLFSPVRCPLCHVLKRQENQSPPAIVNARLGLTWQIWMVFDLIWPFIS